MWQGDLLQLDEGWGFELLLIEMTLQKPPKRDLDQLGYPARVGRTGLFFQKRATMGSLEPHPRSFQK